MSMSDCPKCWETPCACGHEYRDWTVERLKEQIEILEEIMFFKQYKLPELQSNENLQCIVIIQEIVEFPEILCAVVGRWVVCKRSTQNHAIFKVFRDEKHIHTGDVPGCQRGDEPTVIIYDELNHVLHIEGFSDLKVGDLLLVINEKDKSTENETGKETQSATFRPPVATERFRSVWEAIEDDPEKRAELEHKSRLMMRVKDVISTHSAEELQKRFGISHALIEYVTLASFNDIDLEDLVALAKSLGVDPE